jgi:hypothetical protein
MFELRAQATFTWPAKAKVPDGGKYETVPFDVTFKVLSQEEINVLIGDDAEGGSIRVLREALVSFSGFPVRDEDGELCEDDESRNDIILRVPYFVSALSDAWIAGISGRRIKN